MPRRSEASEHKQRDAQPFLQADVPPARRLSQTLAVMQPLIRLLALCATPEQLTFSTRRTGMHAFAILERAFQSNTYG